MRNHDARLRRLEARKKGVRIVMAPPEGSPEYSEWMKAQAADTIIIAFEDAGV